MATTIYRTWCDRISSGTFTKGQCAQWAHAVIPLSRGEMPGGMKTSLTGEEAQSLVEHLQSKGGVRLTDEHTKQGLTWLERYAEKRLPMLPRDWRERFSHFLYLGDGMEYGSYRSFYVPIWRIVLTDGETWDYYAMAWQTGNDDYAWQVTHARLEVSD